MQSDILAIDDDPRNLLAIEVALGPLASRLVKVRSGEEALRALFEGDFAVILLDVSMPAVDGFEIARLIRARPRTRHVPIIFMTAYRQDDLDIRRGYELGAVDYLFKPIIAEVLQAKVGVFVALRDRTKEAAEQAERLRELERAEAQAALDRERRAWEAASLRRQVEEQCAMAHGLAEADHRKDELMAMMAHELRNPLASIVANLGVLASHPLAHPRQVEARDAMQRQLGHLTRMVDDLLVVSRVTRGKIALDRAWIDLAEVVQRATETCRALLIARDQELLASGPEAPVMLDGDLVRLTQVVSNLLSNASRYSEAGQSVRVRWWEEDETAVIRVEDDGRGIASELLPRIFDSFVQGRSGGRGLGLGLTLVKQLVELHGGDVTATSDGPGEGSQLTVRLPRGTPPTAPMRIASPAVRSGLLDVVIVEDDVDVRDAIRALCEDWGHQVRAATSGRHGLELLLERPPDVALIDIGLPDLDGYEIARGVRARVGDRTRLIALSGYGQPRDRDRSRRAGFDVHLAKPVTPERLREEIEAIDATSSEID